MSSPQTDDAPSVNPDIVSLLCSVWESIKMNRLLAIITAGAACALIVFLISLNSVLNPNNKKESPSLTDVSSPVVESAVQSTSLNSNYDKAVSLMDAGKYDEAISILETLNGHKDSAVKLSQCHYSKATNFTESGNTLKALCSFSAAGDYEDAPAQAATLRKLYQNALQLETFSASRNHIVVLKD